MEDERKKYLDCLLADFASIKGEIRRRATLQRFVLLGFAAVLAFTFKEAASNNLSAYWITGLWVSSFLALLFYFREGLEIGRLGSVIAGPIAVAAAREFRVHRTHTFHSEHPQSYISANNLLPDTTPYDRLFNWTVFLMLPAFVTLKFIWPVRHDLFGKIAEYPFEVVMYSLAAISALPCLNLLLSYICWILSLIGAGAVGFIIWTVRFDSYSEVVKYPFEAISCVILFVLCLELLLRHQSPWIAWNRWPRGPYSWRNVDRM